MMLKEWQVLGNVGCVVVRAPVPSPHGKSSISVRTPTGHQVNLDVGKARELIESLQAAIVEIT